jgi:predicted Zn-dependent peptidase
MFDPFSKSDELLLTTAFGGKTLGMPMLGKPENVNNLNVHLLQ